jgi:hypothetical protein
MLLVETATDLLRRIGVVMLPLALQPDLSAQLVHAFRLRQAGVGRLQRGFVADPVLGIVDVAAELILIVVDLSIALSTLLVVRVLVHFRLVRRLETSPAPRLGPLIEMTSRAASAVIPVALAKLATLSH